MELSEMMTLTLRLFPEIAAATAAAAAAAAAVAAVQPDVISSLLQEFI